MPHPQANAILSQLPHDELQFLLPHMKMVSLKKGDILFEPGGSIDHYYFPLTCTLELIVDLPEGNSAATTVINMNGMYPLHLIGQPQSHNRAMVSNSGLCYRVPAWVVQEELRRSQSFLWLLLREAVSLFERASVESACLRHHSLEQVTAKLILLSMDQSRSPVVAFTQQEMANSLGVRREGVTMTLQKFKQNHLISTHRGSVKVLNRAGLEQRACSCYQTIKEIDARLGQPQVGKRITNGK